MIFKVYVVKFNVMSVFVRYLCVCVFTDYGRVFGDNKYSGRIYILIVTYPAF